MHVVMPAKAGIQNRPTMADDFKSWISGFRQNDGPVQRYSATRRHGLRAAILELAQPLAGVDLARAVDAVVRAVALFEPVSDPAGQAPEHEHDGEHLGRDAHRAVDDAAVEVYVRVQLTLDEVLVLERGFFHLLGEVEQRVVDTELLEYFVRGFFEQLRARIEVLVHAVAETHEALFAFAALHVVEEFLAIAALGRDRVEHFDHALVRAAVARAPQRAHTRRD